ncbi:MAG: ELWxxDGT repeat protein [Anaerolineae bacterium]
MARRTLSVVLFAALLLSCVPTVARADGPRVGPAAVADTLTLFKDINPGPALSSQSVNGMVAVGNLFLLFAANEAAYGFQPYWSGGELWRSDGTPAGTYLLKDIRPGRTTSEIMYLTAVGGHAYFSADDGSHGAELWVTDGTAGGTMMLADVNPGADSSWPEELTPVSDTTMFFTADDGSHGRQLWVTNGTAAGTRMLTSGGGGNGSHATWLASAGIDSVLFSGCDAAKGCELWRSDGTVAGTALFKDIYPDAGSSYPQYLVNINDIVYFAAASPGAGTEFWRSAGSPFLTSLVDDINPGPASSNPRGIAGDGTSIYFSAQDATHGREIYVSTGVPGAVLRDVRPGAASSDPGTAVPVYYSGATWVFFAATGPANGRELYYFPDSAQPPLPIADIAPGGLGSDPHELIAVGETLYLNANDGSHGYELWQCRRVPVGLGFLPLPSMVKDSNPGGNGYPYDLTALGGKLYFGAYDQEWHGALWQTDGTTAGTTPVSDFRPGVFDSFPYALTLHQGALYFVAHDANGQELWRSDGTVPGTQIAADVNAGPGDAFPIMTGDAFRLVSLGAGSPGGAALYFAAYGGPGTSALWRYDGSAPAIVQTTTGSPDSSAPDWLTAFNGWLYAPGNDSSHGRELFRSNGIPNGQPGAVLELVADIAPGADDAYPTELTPFEGWLYFAASSSAGDRELWRSDGLPGGTTERVTDISATSDGSSPWDLVVAGSYLYFTAEDDLQGSGHGREPWRTAGGVNDATMVADLCPGPCSLEPYDLTAVGARLYFTANDNRPGLTWGGHGRELWCSNGAAEGTYMVADILPGPVGSLPSGLADVAGTLWFSASDGLHGAEPWVSDGAQAGTYMVQDLFAGPGNSSPSGFTVMGNRVYFAANDAAAGYELWSGALTYSVYVPLARRSGG